MRHSTVLHVMGNLLFMLGVIMFVPLLIALYYGESLYPFAVAIVASILSGSLLSINFEEKERWYHREGFAIVAGGWLLAAAFGSIPFILSGISPINAFFESMSGFTTTGSTVLMDIESYSRSLLFWRSMTQWLGGMGIILLFIAILPKLGVAGREMYYAEVPGPDKEGIKPRVRETAKLLWMVYLLLSVIMVLIFLILGLSLYDSVTHTFTTVACGGFSPYADSIAAFNSPLIEGTITLFMFLAGINFVLHYRTLYGPRKDILRDEEFRFYLAVVFLAIVALAFVLWRDMNFGIFDSLRYASFQSLTIITSTGFASADFDLWTDSSRMILLALMFTGGCASSTAGGIKMVRILLLLKYTYIRLKGPVLPLSVNVLRLNGREVPLIQLQSVIAFVVLYLAIFCVSSLILAELGLDIVSAITASIATLGNIGPGLGMVGPMENFAMIPVMGKIILIFNMWAGRLEIFTVLVLLTPEFWKNR